MSLPLPEPNTSSNTLYLISDSLKLVFSRNDEHHYRYLTEIKTQQQQHNQDPQWQPACRLSNAATPILGLSDTRCTLQEDQLILTGESADSSCRWQTAISAEAGGFWLTTTLHLTSALTLNPLPLLWLGTLDRLDDRQAHTWRQAILRAPTTNQQGLSGNDLPAGYLYDDAANVETICYFPADALNWLPYRLCQFTVREVFRYSAAGGGTGGNRYGFGLLPTAVDGTVEFAGGTHTIRWWFTQRRRERTPSLWQAQRLLVEAIQPLLNVQPSRIAAHAEQRHQPSWQRMAEGTLADLHDPACWTEADGVAGLRAYVAGSSRVGRDQQQGFELMTQLDVLLPLLLWRQVFPFDHPVRHSANTLIGKLRATLTGFYRPDLHFMANHFPVRARDTFMDTWYFFENALIKLPYVAHLTQDEALKRIFFDAITGATALAHNVGYLFPLFADASDWRARGSLLNVSTGGMYAAGQLLAYQLSGEHAHLEEAAQALQVLAQLPPAQLTHEPQQLSYGAAAANFLAQVTGDDTYSIIAADLMALLLRMGYWTADPRVPYYDPRGMFQACASLCYPAFKENVECLIAAPELLGNPRFDRNGDAEGDGALRRLLVSFSNLQRRHNFSFFDAYLPPQFPLGPCPHIPYEDLATAEFPHTATLGKELYGAGEVFWSALLFEALGQVDDPDVLCLSLDLPCVQLLAGSFPPSTQRRFLLYNPTSSRKEVEVATPSRDSAALTASFALAPSEIQLIAIELAPVDPVDSVYPSIERSD